jgi:phospholipid/cholesterol/gamma-HCH transport system substrate-binding protein
MARRNVAETLTGTAVLLVAGGFLAFAVAHSGQRIGTGYPLTARFLRIDGLGVGSDVRVAGVKVGSVTATAIDPKSFEAVVTLTVADDLKLPADSGAAITSDGLLGGKYLDLTPGGEEKTLAPGGQIKITQSSINIEDLLGKFVFSMANMSNSGKPDDKNGGGKNGGDGGLDGGGKTP